MSALGRLSLSRKIWLARKWTHVEEQECYDSSKDDVAGTLMLHVNVLPERPDGKATVAVEAFS